MNTPANHSGYDAQRPDPAAESAASIRGIGFWSGLVLAVLCVIYASYARVAQLSVWKGDPALYAAAGVPMMTTLDAYYSLRLARLQAAGTFVPHGPAPARHYSRPEQADPDDWYDQREPKSLPTLPAVLATVAPVFGGDIDKAGLLLSPLLSSLFIIPLFLCGWRLGVPAAGLMGGLVATFCLEYYQRTSVGWVDTDALNLFFPWTVSWLILEMRRGQSRVHMVLLAATAGVVLYAFFLWYGKAGLTFLYACALAVYLLLDGVSWRRTSLCVLALVVFANPTQFADLIGSLEEFGRRYLFSAALRPPIPASGIRFPEVWSTISEMRPLHWTEVLKRVLARADVSAIGLIAFVPFALWRWRKMAALSPMLLLGMLALMSSRRFIPYLAPFVGLGWGLIVSFIVGSVFLRFRGARDRPGEASAPLVSSRGVRFALAPSGLPAAAACVAAVALFAAWFAPSSGKAFVPRPAIPGPVFRDLQIMGERLPAHARMWTWWDLGFAIEDATPFGVYHDGSAQYTPQTNLIAASFVAPDPHLLHDIIRFVDREGNRGIRRLAATAGTFDGLLTQMRDSARPLDDVPVYVLYTSDMLLKYSAMRSLGTVGPAAAPRRGSFGIRWLDCERIADEILHCAQQAFNLRTGRIEWRNLPSPAEPDFAQLRSAVIVEGGRVLREQAYTDTAQLHLEIVVQSGAVKAVYLLEEPAFQSNLNQMFVLGRFDASRFEEAFNDAPYARAFRVLPSAR